LHQSLVITPAALDSIPIEEATAGVRRHSQGNWGELDELERSANEAALVEDRRLFSAYRTASGIRFYLITEHDRSATTVLLPEDY
jgi:hypothetical protein